MRTAVVPHIATPLRAGSQRGVAEVRAARLKVQETGDETNSSPPQTGGLCSTPDFAAAARGKNLYFVRPRLGPVKSLPTIMRT